MIERTSIQQWAMQIAMIQEAQLLRDGDRLNPEVALPQSVRLVRDYVHHLNQPVRAVSFVLSFHATIERWSSWAVWAEVLDLLLNASGSHTTPQITIQLLNCRSQAARELADDDGARASATQALQLATELEDEALIASAYNKLGLVALRRDELETAATLLNKAYTMGRAVLSMVELGHISMNAGITAVQRGDLDQALQHFNTAIQHYELQDNPIHMAKAHCNLADLLRRKGILKEIPPTLLSARDLFKRLQAHYEYGLAENDIGCIHLSLNQYTLAEKALLRAKTTFEQLGAMTAKARVLSNLAALYVNTAQWPKAEAAIEEGRTLARLCHKPLLIATIDIDYGKLLYAQGDRTMAQQVWTAALAVQQSKGVHMAAARTAQLLHDLGATEEVSKALGR